MSIVFIDFGWTEASDISSMFSYKGFYWTKDYYPEKRSVILCSIACDDKKKEFNIEFHSCLQRYWSRETVSYNKFTRELFKKRVEKIVERQIQLVNKRASIQRVEEERIATRKPTLGETNPEWFRDFPTVDKEWEKRYTMRWE